MQSRRKKTPGTTTQPLSKNIPKLLPPPLRNTKKISKYYRLYSENFKQLLIPYYEYCNSLKKWNRRSDINASSPCTCRGDWPVWMCFVDVRNQRLALYLEKIQRSEGCVRENLPLVFPRRSKVWRDVRLKNSFPAGRAEVGLRLPQASTHGVKEIRPHLEPLNHKALLPAGKYVIQILKVV